MTNKKTTPMTKEDFAFALDKIKKEIENKTKTNITPEEKDRLFIFLNIVNSYTYDNRLEKKGLIGYGVIDSALWGTGIYDIGQELLKFDQGIR
ncbi:MAG: hypothetical protein LBM71_04650 [Elusimicrobiota bacterium]|jgi:hypothetical protein|nr:hypothetical protein [Elusimicrobiota bacterium]